MENNETENKRILFFERINKIGKPLYRPNKKKNTNYQYEDRKRGQPYRTNGI